MPLISPRTFSIEALLSAIATHPSESEAVCCGSRRIDYGELNSYSNAIAHLLEQQGVVENDAVAIYADRSIELVTAVVGIMKARAAYVPLDVAAPADRTRWTIEDCQARVILTVSAHLPHLRELVGEEVVIIALDNEQITPRVVDSAQEPVGESADRLAYIIYTSGSSGLPKGVAVTVNNLAQSTLARTKYYIHKPERSLIPLAFVFDAAGGLFWWTLYSGGLLVIPEPGSATDAIELARIIQSDGITHIATIPSVYTLVLDVAKRGQLSTLQVVMTGGEAMSPALVRYHYEAAPQATLYNEYGPTEATVWASCYKTSAEDGNKSVIPIGKAVDHVQFHVLNEAQEPVPEGQDGELWIGGPGVARGYLNRPDLTEAHFVNSITAPDTRLYRTGDIVQVLPDGNFIYRGRTDHQVKVNGVRIELGEIEQVLLNMDQITGAAVLFRGTGVNQKELVGFVELSASESSSILSQDTEHDSAESRRQISETILAHLTGILPEVMVPNRIIILDAMPVLVSGKVDRKALENIPLEVAESRQPRVLPRNGIEQALMDIWQSLLKHSDFGVRDDFFFSGGHSLIATQVISRIRTVLNREVSLRSFFENSTIEKLARLIANDDDHPQPSDQPISVLTRHPGQPLIAPTSFSQRRMWMVQQANPQGTAYNMAFAIKMTGGLDQDLFKKSLSIIAQRHEAFRTTFDVIKGDPVQVIKPVASPINLEVVDLSSLSPAERETAAINRLREESLVPFELNKDPLHRTIVIRLNDKEHIFLWLIHHVIGDQWSAGIIFNELSLVYKALRSGQEPELQDYPVEYSDFSAWQRSALGNAALDKQLAYWRKHLEGIEVLSLPLDKPRPAVQSFRGAKLTADLSDEFISKLHHWSAARGLTSFMTMLGVFQVILARYSGQENVAIGCPIANRTKLDSEHLVGTLVNTLVMRADVSDDPTFDDFISRVRATTLEAFLNQDLPFERIVDELVTSRDTSHSPLVQVLFNVVNAPVDLQPLDNVNVEMFDFDSGSVQFDLNISVDLETVKKIHLGYAADLFTHESGQRILNSYVALLTQILDDSTRPLSSYELLTAQEESVILYDWNATESNYPRDKRVDHIFAERVRENEDTVAVSMYDQTLSYGDLDKQSNQLCHYLQKQGIGSGKFVGVCLDRSPAVVVTLLAIVKSGAAYVPLDPAFPKERLELMANSAGLAAIVTQSSLKDLIACDREVLRIELDTASDNIRLESSEHPDLPGTSSVNAPAYVLYTSGSTGAPKGVVIPHRALTNFLCSMRDTPGCSSDDRLLSITTLSFDISGLELFLPLITGAQVEVVSKDEAMDGRQLISKMKEFRPSIMQATPATWRMLIDSGWEGDKNLKILCGGEPLSPELAQELLERCGELWNVYGPTETTIWSTVEQIVGPEITIGRPIANTTVYILDKSLKPVPIGVPGELFIGGDGVAVGYHNRQDLTDERFLANPFTGVPGDRIYRTGDLARWLPDGRLVHLGRMDFQVKIRGFRIELGEIESILLKHPDVSQAVVAARKGADGMDQLVAYVIPSEFADNTVREFTQILREHVRKALPAYMVPAHIVLMDEFPLTANNKVNVKALPEPSISEQTDIEVDSTVEPPDTLTLQLLLLWRQVLGSQSIGVDDNFFESGGHSLKAIQLLSHVNTLVGKELPLATLFQAPTVSQLVKLLTQDGWEPTWRSLVAINPTGTKPPVFAVPGVGGNVLMFSHFAKTLGPQTPFYGLQARGLDGKTEPFTSIHEMASHNISEIKTVHPNGPYVIVGVCTGGVVAYEMAHRLRAAGEECVLIMTDTWHPTSYTGSIVPKWAMETLRPLQFWSGKAFGYTRELLSLSPSQWRSFIKRKMDRAMVVLENDSIETVLTDGSYYREKMREATIDAIRAYEAKPYNYPFMYVYASKRVLRSQKHDTRRLWKTLSEAEVLEREIAAIDSGQMFVPSAVGEIAGYVEEYVESNMSRLADRQVS